MLPEVLFLRTCKAEKGFFPKWTFCWTDSDKCVLCCHRGLRTGFIPSSSACHIPVPGGVPLFAPSNWLILFLLFIFLLYIVVNFPSCLKCLWIRVHVLFFLLTCPLPTCLITCLPVHLPACLLTYPPTHQSTFYFLAAFLAMYMVHISISRGFFKVVELVFFSFFDQIIRAFPTILWRIQRQVCNGFDREAGDPGLIPALPLAECLVLGTSFSL